MHKTLAGRLILIVPLLTMGAVCVNSCQTDPLVELNTPTAVKSGSTVTITVTGEESQPTNYPPYDDYNLYAKLYHTGTGGTDHPEIGPYGWPTGAWMPCTTGGTVKRQYRGFTITWPNLTFISGDKFRVRIRSDEREGFDPFEVWSPEITVP